MPLIYGFHAVLARIRQGAVQEIYIDADRRDGRSQELREAAKNAHVTVREYDRSRLDTMIGTDKHQGVVAAVEAKPLAKHLDDVLDDLSEDALLLILDGVQDPHNLGACFRVADAFGAHALIVPKDRAVGLNATVRKVASGAADSVPFFPVTNLARTLRELKDRGIWLTGAAGDGDSEIASVQFNAPSALVLGAEGAGLRRLTREVCDRLVRIPMFGTVESLNVSVSAGICLYEARRQRASVT